MALQASQVGSGTFLQPERGRPRVCLRRGAAVDDGRLLPPRERWRPPCDPGNRSRLSCVRHCNIEQVTFSNRLRCCKRMLGGADLSHGSAIGPCPYPSSRRLYLQGGHTGYHARSTPSYKLLSEYNLLLTHRLTSYLICSTHRLPCIAMPRIDMPRLGSTCRLHIFLYHVTYITISDGPASHVYNCHVTHITTRDGTGTPRIHFPSFMTPSTQYLSSQFKYSRVIFQITLDESLIDTSL
jgi:hypothetical protein